MKTLFLFQNTEDESLAPKFFELEGDYSRFNGIYINQFTNKQTVETLQQELADLIYNEHGYYKVKFENEPSRDWSIFVHCGFLD